MGADGKKGTASSDKVVIVVADEGAKKERFIATDYALSVPSLLRFCLSWALLGRS